MSNRKIAKAAELYQTFTEFTPKHVETSRASIPATVACLGTMKSIFYASNKWEGKVNYYKHDHDAGVHVYRPGGARVTPSWLQKQEALARLGRCIGFIYVDAHGDEREMKAVGCDLYATPNGKALALIDKKSLRLELLIWGGRLKVEDRGIVH